MNFLTRSQQLVILVRSHRASRLLALALLLVGFGVKGFAQTPAGKEKCSFLCGEFAPPTPDPAKVEAARAEMAKTVARYKAAKAAEAAKQEAAWKAAKAKREAVREAQIAALDATAEGKDRLRRHEVWVGATPEMARLAWGPPQTINRTIGKAQVDEQWVYGLGTYLYFTNGKLTTIQQERAGGLR